MRSEPGTGIPTVDWSAPWLVPYRDAGSRLGARLSAGASVAEALNAELAVTRPSDHGACAARFSLAAGPLRFVPQRALPFGMAYEAYIHATAQVPTRDVLHDLFNGLVWLRFPRLKRRLNELQAGQLRGLGAGTARGSVRDALTLFDENAAWLPWPDSLAEPLRRRDWAGLFLRRRADWQGAAPTLFGHALMQKLCAPRKAITAHAWLVPQGLGADRAEAWLCESLTPQRLAARSHHPLPVLGVPGWWPANESPDFYDDVSVFRPARDGPQASACDGEEAAV